MHWDALLQSVLDKKAKSLKKEKFKKTGGNKSVQEEKPRKHFLGMEHRNVYFTSREAEVMVQLLQGKTLSAAAAVLNLSPRTIEFYVKNMKTKLACRTKSELIGKVFASDFIKSVDFITR